MSTSYHSLLTKQKVFFNSGTTKTFNFRITQLKKLKFLIKQYEKEILTALKKDLFKCEMEALGSELLLIYDELDFAIKNLKKWMQPIKVGTPFPLLWPGTSKVYFEPYGSVLIISPWNYPFLLTFSPLIGAISAGNCAFIKPSEMATHSQKLIIEILNHFPSNYIAPIDAGPKEVQELLQEQFDYIFFTGAPHIGKSVMEAAGKHLTPLTLELGGKSPCIVDIDADLSFAARRIIWGKMLNAGQTCIAPDYLLVHKDHEDKFIKLLIKTIKKFYGEQPELSDSYGRIINQKHFLRLSELLKTNHIVHGGNTDASNLYIEPTLVQVDSWQHPLLQEEIFGPILPIITYQNLTETINQLKIQPKPLALYLFTNNETVKQNVLTTLSFGGGAINDCLLQTANMNLPFGGVGLSGFGGYHGKYSFELFSHRKSIYSKRWLLDLDLQYPPYTRTKLKWFKRLFLSRL